MSTTASDLHSTADGVADTATSSPSPEHPDAVQLQGSAVLMGKPGQTLLWLGVMAAAGLWIQTTWFPEAEPPPEPAGVAGGGALSPAVLKAMQKTGVDDAGAKASGPIAAKDAKRKQGLVNLFKRLTGWEDRPAPPAVAAVADGAGADDPLPGDDAAPAAPAGAGVDDGSGGGGGSAPSVEADGVQLNPSDFGSDDDVSKALDALPVVAEDVPAAINQVWPVPPKPTRTGDEPVLIEDPHDALKPFFDALDTTARKEQGAITRVVQFGDSTIVADRVTGTMRRKLQERFGDSGHGWLLVGKPWDYYVHDNVWFDAHANWRMSRLTSNPTKDRRHGLGGVTTTGFGTGIDASFHTSSKGPVGQKVSRFEVYYSTDKRGGKFAVDVDKKEQVVIDTASDTVEDKVAKITFPDGDHKIRLRIASAGTVRLFGVVMGRDVPGVVYDSLGVTGTRAKIFIQRHDPAHFKNQLKLRDPHLMVVMLGTNESEFESMDLAEYEREFEILVKRLRAALPERACMVASPPDRAKKGRMGRLTTAPLIPQMVEIQRKVALRNKCAFWNTFEAMGGEGAMGAWYRNSPRLASGDFTHFTAAGGEVLGTLFYEALMKAYDGRAK